MIIEKPAEVSLAKTDEIIAAQQAAGRLVTVISQHRFDRAFEITLKAIATGELGRVTSGIASIDWWRSQRYYDSGDWRGCTRWRRLSDEPGVHTVDLLVAALGQLVEVFAYANTLAHERIEVEDALWRVVRFASGAPRPARDHGGTRPERPAPGSRRQGSVVIENDEFTFVNFTPAGTDPQEKAYGSSAKEINQADDYRSEGNGSATAGRDPGELSDAHCLQYLSSRSRGEEEIRVGLAENRQSISVIVGVYESARTGRPVSLA